MPNSVDNRIVEMQFDNKNFEKNINQSIKSLQQLDKSLEFKDADKGFKKLEQAANNVDLSKMEKSISFIEYRLSVLGMTSAKIINSVTDKIGGLFKTIERNTIGQIKSGGMSRALNIESAKFQLEGLGIAWRDIEEDINYGVKNTAYGLDAAAKAASQLSASGIELGDDMKQALRGISGVAAMTNSSYEEISRIFTTVAGQGRMMGDQLNQLSARGLNAAATLGKALNKTEAEIREMVSKGKISFADFAKAMDDAYGEHAKDANKTFSGALSNMKAALSRIGADVATPYLEHMREVFVALTGTINDVHKALKPLLNIMGHVIGDFKNFIVDLTGSQKFISFYQNGIKKITDLAERVYNIFSTTIIKTSTLNDIHDIISGIAAAIEIVVKCVASLLSVSSPVGSMLNVILNIVLKLLAAIGRLLVKLNETNTVTNKFKAVISTIGTVLRILLGLLVVIVRGIVNAISAFMDLPIVKQVFNDIADAATNLAKSAIPFLEAAIGALLYVVDRLINSIREGNIHGMLSFAADKIKAFGKAAKDGFKAVGSFFGIFENGVWKMPGSIKAFAKTIDTVDSSISTLTGDEKKITAIQKINDSISSLADSIGNVGNYIMEKVRAFGIARTLITGLSVSLIGTMMNVSKMVKAFTSIGKSIPGLIDAISSSLQAPMFNAKAKAVIAGVAVGIGMLTIALFVLSRVPIENLQAVTLCLAELMTLITLLGIAFSKFGGGLNGAASMATVIVSFAASVTLITGALKVLESIKLPWQEMLKRIGYIGLIMLALVGSMRILRANGSIFGSVFMLAFAFAISKLVESLSILASNPNLDAIDRALPILLHLLAGLALVGAACSLLSPLAGIGFMGIIGGLILMVIGLNELANKLALDPDAFERMSAVLSRIYNAIKGWLFFLAGIAAIIAVRNLLSSISDVMGGVASAASALVEPATIAAEALKRFATAAVIGAIVLGIVAISNAIVRIGQMKPDEVKQGLFAAGVILVALFAFIGSLALIQRDIVKDQSFLKGLGTAALGAAALIISVAAALKIISSIDPDSLGLAFIALIGVVALVTGIIAVCAVLSQNDKAFAMGIKTAVAISTMILAITLALGLLSMLYTKEDWPALLVAGGAILLIMLGIAAICYAMSQIDTKPAIATAVAMAVFFGGFTASMILLKDIPWDDIAKKLAVMAGTVVVLGYILRLIGENMTGKQLAVGAAGIAVILLTIGGLAAVFRYIVQETSFDAVYPILLAMGAAITVLAAIMALFAEKMDWEGIKKSAASMAILVGVFAGFAVVMWSVSQIDPTNLLPNLLAIGVTIGVLSGILAAFVHFGKDGFDDIAKAELAMFGLAGIFGAFTFVMTYVAQIDPTNLLPNLIAIGASLAVLAGIAYIIGGEGVLKYIVPGELAMAGLVVIFGALGFVAGYIATINVEQLRDNLITLAVAVGVLSVIVGILGGLMIGTGGIGAMVFAAGCAALLALAGVMYVVAAVGSKFAKTIDEIADALDGFAEPLKEVADAMEYLAKKDFDGILGNVAAMVAGIEAIGLVKNKAKEGAEGLKALGDSIDNLENHSERLTTVTNQVAESGSILAQLVGSISKSLESIPEAMSKAADALSSDDLYKAVDSMAEKLKTFSASKMYNVGIQMVEDICKGFSEMTGIEAPSMMSDFAGGIEAGVTNEESRFFNAGLTAAQAFVEGFRSKEGIDSHSNSVEAILCMKDYVGGCVEGINGERPRLEETGQFAGNTIVEQTSESLEAGTGTIQDSMLNALGGVQETLNNNHLTAYLDVQGADFLKNLGLGDLTSGATQKGGLTLKQKESAAAEDAKRNSMYGYNTIEALTRAGQAGELAHKWAHKAAKATKEETAATEKNSKAQGGSSKAKKENAKANEKKTKAIDEETEALNEETEAVEDNEEAIREQAEAIEVVTEKFKDYLNTYQFKDPFKASKGLTKSMSKLWDAEDKSLKDVNKTYKKVSKSLTNSIVSIKKQVVKFNDSGKYLGKFSDKLYKNVAKIEKKVLKTGKTIMKVTGPVTKVFYKVGDSVEKMTITTTKNIKKLGKHFQAAKNFIASFNDEIEHQESSEEFILNLRNIEKYFGATKFGKLADKAKNYIRGIVEQFDEVRNSMNIMAKNIDGIGNVLSKKSKASAYVADSFLSLAASLYDGSDAANEYATEHAKLLFLMENGLATQEEVDEHFQSYISRLKETIVEYRNTIYQNLSGSMDIFSEFNKNLMEEGSDLIHNIESQIAGYYNWGNMLMELSKRGFDQGIIKMLTDEGVSSFGKAKALIDMTADELALFTVRYQQSQAVIETATDTALAAVANAQNRASLRAAAAQGDKTAQQQLKMSKKRKKELLDDAKAVADFQAQYNKLTAKEEKEYLKSLTKDERKAYKAQLKAAKKQQKQLQKAANREAAKRAEKERVDGILASIKAMSDYITVIRKYNDDTSVMEALTKQITEGFKPLQETFPNITFGANEATDAILAFGETLDATGEDGLTYFEEITKRIQNFTNSIIDSVKGVDYLGQAFERVSDISLKSISDNAISNIAGYDQLIAEVNSLGNLGLSNPALTAIMEKIKSSPAEALAYIKALRTASAEEILEINAYYDLKEEQAKRLAESSANSMINTTSKKILEENVKSRQDAVKKATDAETKAYQKVAEVQGKLNDLEAEKSKKQTELTELKDRKRYLQELKKTRKLTNKEKKELESLKGNLGKIAAKEREIYEISDKISNLKTGEMYEAEKNRVSATNEVAKAVEELRKAEQRLAEYEAQIAKAREVALKNANLKIWYEENVKSLEDFMKKLRQLSQTSDEFKLLMGDLANFSQTFSDTINVYETSGNFETIKSFSTFGDVIGTIREGLLSFAESISTFDEGMTFAEQMQVMTQALEEYQDSLESSIRSSSDFFSMFSGFSDENNPLTATNYLEYADSQLDALKTWSDNLKQLADRGLDKELLEKFASQGLSSYEMVNAWVNATDKQIAEYNYQWREYQARIEEATTTAMASIGAAWSMAGQQIQENMYNLFDGNSERFEQVGYEASAMIISGVKDGLTNAMPEIISAVEQNASSSAMATAVGKQVGTAINTGLATAISASVTDTVNAAIEKFKMAVDAVNSYVEETLNTEWTINVHVNTSDIDDAVARMNAAIYGINADANQTSSAYSTSRENAASVTVAASDGSSVVNNNVTYQQTINSPTAMNQVEIYRESKAVANQMINTMAVMTNG